jgi:predicted nicotinamide N-methyase
MNVGSPLLHSKTNSTHAICLDNNISVTIATTHDETLETGGSLWHSSYLFANYLINNPDIVRDKNILEIGSGMECILSI